MGSILNTTKKALGMGPDYDPFDEELIMFINSTLSTINQLGVGPELGMAISGPEESWEDFLGGDPRLNEAMTVMYFTVKLAFDPDAQGFVLASRQKMRDEAIWRLSVQRETIDHPQSSELDPEEPMVLDAGEV